MPKKTILWNWKNKNSLNINQYRYLALHHIGLETASASTSALFAFRGCGPCWRLAGVGVSGAGVYGSWLASV